MELARVELRNGVVDVENDLRPGQLGQPGGKDEEVRDIMYVDQIVTLPKVLPRQLGRRQQPEFQQRQKISALVFFSLCVSSLNAMDAHTSHFLDLWLAWIFLYGEDIHAVAAVRQRFRIANHPSVTLIRSIGNH